MLTREHFENWEKAIAVADSLKKEIGNQLRHVWQEYEKFYTGYDRFPDTVESIELEKDTIQVWGWVSRDPDMNGCSIPVDFAFADEETRLEIARKYQEVLKAEKENDARLKEEKDRAEYERLQAKFGSGS